MQGLLDNGFKVVLESRGDCFNSLLNKGSLFVPYYVLLMALSAPVRKKLFSNIDSILVMISLPFWV
ncbi:hypothetical protein MNBD_GAMMA11-582 [hydrothermal vent metagenome]|uniref:Uncharacterized protein n=1 Tax=hydrothermal vent metagenome TaxID=652676 RepID=A0A3B0XJR7_9ZZZZ